MNFDSQIVGAIYEAIEDDRAWHEAFRHIASATGSRTAGMFRLDASGIGLSHSWNMPQEFMIRFGNDYAGNDPRIARALRYPIGAIMPDSDPEVRRSMVRTGVDDLVRSFDLPYTASSLFRHDHSGLWGLYISRSQTEGPADREHVEQLKLVQRHVQRAVSLKLKLARSELLLRLRDHNPEEHAMALLLVNGNLKLRWADPTAEQLLRDSATLTLQRETLRLAYALPDRQLRRALDAVARGESAQRVHLATNADDVVSIEVLPYRDRGWLTSTAALFALVIRFETMLPTPTLSPRQRVVVELLGEGLTNREIGARLSISVNTVRNHLSSVFELLGAHNRTECVALARRGGLLPRLS